MAASKSANTKIVLNITSFILHILLNIIFYVLVVLIVSRLSTAAYDFAYQLYGTVSVEEAPGTDVKIQIKKGESTMTLAKKLEYNRVILNKNSFFVRAKLSTSAKKPILAGTYILNTSMNYEQILDVITDINANQEKTAGTDSK